MKLAGEGRHKNTSHTQRILPSPRIKSPILSSPPPLGDQLPKQTAAVMKVINMIDGISVSADLKPRARILGAGAARIYSLPPSYDGSLAAPTETPTNSLGLRRSQLWAELSVRHCQLFLKMFFLKLLSCQSEACNN